MRVKIALAMLVILVGWIVLRQKPDERVKVIFCDVGQGDGTIVEKGSFQMVIDTGFDNGKMLRCMGEHLPFWDKEIEVMMISHWDSDHSGALKSISKYYKIDSLVTSQMPNKDSEQNLYTTLLSSGDYLKVGEISFEILGPEESGDKTNDGSLVGILKYNDKSYLFTGDATEKMEQRLVWRNILNEKVDVLKVSHHGSAEATSKELLEVIKPEAAVISVGKDNKFGHPTKTVLERLKEAGVSVYRTDESGDVVVEAK